MLAAREPSRPGVATIQIDCSGLNARDARHLFSDLPLHTSAWHTSSTTTTADASMAEREALISSEDRTHGKRHAHQSWEERVPRIMYAVSAVVCTVALIGAIVAAVILFRRIDTTISTIDSAVSIHASATNMIRNVDTILNTSARIAGTVHDLGLKGLDASVFSRPYLAQMLNTTNNLLQDVHRVAEHPSIHIGG